MHPIFYSLPSTPYTQKITSRIDLKILSRLASVASTSSHVMRRTQNSPKFKKKKKKKEKRKKKKKKKKKEKKKKKKKTSPATILKNPPQTVFLLAWVQHFLPQGSPEDAFKKSWELFWFIPRPGLCDRHAALAVRVFFLYFFLFSPLRTGSATATVLSA